MPDTAVIEVKSLSKSYGDLLAVNSINFTVNKGEIFGLLGPNGAGKSTTIKLLAGLLKPDKGSLDIDYNLFDNNISSTPTIGLCPQENLFWPGMTCFEQCCFMARMYKIPSKLAKEKATYLLERLGLTGKKHKLASTLSGGMKRRLNIALSLVHNPSIAIFDEPEAGLDPQSRLLVREFIREYARKKTVVLTTHNMDEADRICDRIAIIDQGNILIIDSPDKLKKSIGEGDVLHLTVDRHTQAIYQELIKSLPNQVLLSVLNENEISIRSVNLINYIPIISGQISANGSQILNMELRSNTLEDVFIHLTGRSLRK
jgi:ABC-2 type transport system ATP-binding protein